MEAWRTRQLKTLERLTHQLKGSSAGYGFPSIGAAAAKVESSLNRSSPEQVKLAEISAGVDELIDLCRRAASGNSRSAKAA
jgi:HPt (histidine-containing phosphotransfer) domain-containing protein